MTAIYTTLQTIPNDAPVISRYGDDNTFVELSFRRLGDETIELVATKVEDFSIFASPIRIELAREIVSEDDAGPTASDLQWIAAEALDGIDCYTDPVGFEEAVELELDATSKEDRGSYMDRAISHNAALIAAE